MKPIPLKLKQKVTQYIRDFKDYTKFVPDVWGRIVHEDDIENDTVTVHYLSVCGYAEYKRLIFTITLSNDETQAYRLHRCVAE